MLLGSITFAVPYGTLIIEDHGNQVPIPLWESDDQLVSSHQAGLLLRVLNGQEGLVTVNAFDRDVEGPLDIECFRGVIGCSSGALCIRDADDTSRLLLPADIGDCEILVTVNDEHFPDKVVVSLLNYEP